MGSKRQWARVKRSGAHGLRRGAWYPVVNDRPTIVVLDVAKRAIPMDRSLLDFRDDAPSQWSVVISDPQTSQARRASEAALEWTYGVCPACRERQNLIEGETDATCESCGQAAPIDWDNPC